MSGPLIGVVWALAPLPLFSSDFVGGSRRTFGD